MKKLTKSALSKKRRIYNSHNFCTAGGGKVLIMYRPHDRGRGGQCAAWQVAGVYFSTDRRAYWRDYGCKTFVCDSTNRDAKLDEAKRWATEEYGITEWVRDPFGGWQDKRVYDVVMR